MDAWTDAEIKRVELQRWQQEAARQDCRLLRKTWRAIVRSHTLLDKPVYKPTCQARVSDDAPGVGTSRKT